MPRPFGKAAFAAMLAAGALIATPAEARHRHDNGDDVAIAVGAGLVGLAIGAAIASSDRRHYRDGYYYDRYYPRYRGYYAHPQYRGYYHDYPRHRRDYDRRRDHYRDHRHWRDDRNRRYRY